MIPLIKWESRAIHIQQSPLISEALKRTYLSADMAVGTAMTVKSVRGFHATTNQPIIIGELGDSTSELVESTTTTAPSTITLAATSVFTHKTGDPVYLLQYNQIEISHATTLTGTKTVLATLDVAPSDEVQIYQELTKSSGYYFARYKETVGGTFSGYSDGVEYGTFARSTAGYMIDRALSDLEINLSDKVTLTDCYEWLNEGMTLIQGKLKRWAEHYSYNTILGQAQRGTNVLAMPTDAYDRETNKSIIGLRIGDEDNLTYLDPVSFDEKLGNVKVTQVTTQAVATDTTLEIDNSYDFADSGTVNVYISGTKYSIPYTGVTRSATAGILTGIAATDITVTIPADTYVWQDENEGIPSNFTVRNSQIEFYPLVDGNEDNQNIYCDYSKVATKVDTDGDVIDYQRYDMLQSYLTWRMKMKTRNNGDMDREDGYYTSFRERLNDAIRTMAQNNKFKVIPSLNRMRKR